MPASQAKMDRTALSQIMLCNNTLWQRKEVVKMKKEMYPGSHKSSMSEILRCDFSSTAWGPLDSVDNKVLRQWGWQQEDFHFQGEASSFLLKVTRLKRNSCEVVEPRLNAKAIGRKGCIGQAAEGWTQIKTARVLTFCLITEKMFQFHKSWWWYWYWCNNKCYYAP